MSGTRIPALVALVDFGTFHAGDIVAVDPTAIAAMIASTPPRNIARILVPYGTQAVGGSSSTGTTTPATGGSGTVSGGTGTTTATGTALTAAQLAAIANEPVDATAIAAQATQIASLQAALAGGSGAAVTTGTLMAAGTSQATAAALPNTINVVTSTPSGAGVILPAGGQCVVENKDPANALLVYPPAGAAIGSGATNAPAQIVPGGTAVFSSINATQWYSE